jgi:hypothetical protein
VLISRFTNEVEEDLHEMLDLVLVLGMTLGSRLQTTYHQDIVLRALE